MLEIVSNPAQLYCPLQVQTLLYDVLKPFLSPGVSLPQDKSCADVVYIIDTGQLRDPCRSHLHKKLIIQDLPTRLGVHYLGT